MSRVCGESSCVQTGHSVEVKHRETQHIHRMYSSPTDKGEDIGLEIPTDAISKDKGTDC